MKNITILFALIFAYACSQKTEESINESTKPLITEITLKEKEFNFGNLALSDSITHRFEIFNTGKHNLIINNVEASCGCTTSHFTKEPVLPGKAAYIDVKFKPNSPGQVNKSIMIDANTQEPFTVLYIKGNVLNDTTYQKKST